MHSPGMIFLPILLAGTVFCQEVVRSDEVSPAVPDEAEIRNALIRGQSNPLLPELSALTIPDLLARPQSAALLQWAREARERTDIPQTTYSLYREYQRTGAREPYQQPYYEKRELMTREVLAAWLDGDDSRIPRVCDLIWSICEESTWVLPAHERGERFIDLFAAETGAELAHAALLLGDRLPGEIRERIQREVTLRILDPYLEEGDQYSWASGRNNWTGVCAGSIGEQFLVLEPDPERQARALKTVIQQLYRYLDRAFEPDGVCLEGIGYWNYGLFHYVAFAEMLRARTGGHFDLLAHPKLAAIARYPFSVVMGPGLFASFSDSHPSASVMPYLAARLAERTGETSLLALAGDCASWRLVTTLRNLLWWDGKKTELPPITDMWFPASGIARLTGTLGGQEAVLAAKAGHNAEPHNHNDVGSFILRVGGLIYLCDPGSGRYSRDYFSAKRYENPLASSYGHSVPRIDGQLQAAGSRYAGTLRQDGEKVLQIDFTRAWDNDSLQSATRRIGFSAEGLTLEDHFVFREGAHSVEEALVTWQPVTIEDRTARIQSAEGQLIITSQDGAFAMEDLREACRENDISGTLSRLTVTRPVEKEGTFRFTLTFESSK